MWGIALCFTAVAYAQEAPAAPVFVAAQLVAPVEPEYPEAALAERLSGEVAAIVTIGVDGTVRDARYAAGGPEVFVAATLAAARRLRFTPATRDGVPVECELKVRFAFAPPEEEPEPYVFESEAGGEEVVVSATRSLSEQEMHAAITLGEAELDRASGQDLAETIGAVPGVVVARGSSNSTKPVIRGQVERRLLVLNDGVRHESQKWGLDHATEIDTFAAGEITVVKGAAGVHYGPDAIGGVVLVAPPRLRHTPGVAGKLQLVGESNGKRAVAAAQVEGASEALPGFAWRLEGNLSRGAAVSTPSYVLGNTGSSEWNLGGTLGYRKGDVSVEGSYHHFDLTGGVCYCLASSTPDGFLAQLELDAPLGAETWTERYEIDRPYQAVTHDTAVLRARTPVFGTGAATFTYAFQLNHREEYDQTRSNITGPQYDFVLRTHSVDAEIQRPDTRLGEWGNLEGTIGLTGSFQENVYSGLPLIPNFRAFQGGIFAIERLNTGAFAVEAGLRYDHLGRTAYLTDSAYSRSLSRGTLSDGDCEERESSAVCAAQYDAASASIGGLWHAAPDRLELRIDLSSATRFPNSDELYMNGSAPTFPVYALGNPGLGTETTWGASPTADLHLPWLDVTVSPYFNYIDDYVYFAPEFNADGSAAVDVTVQGAYPRFTYEAIDALFYGADGAVVIAPHGPVSLTVQAAVVRGTHADGGTPLVGVPADRAEATLAWTPTPPAWAEAPFLEVSGLQVFEQTQADPTADLAPPPEGYFLLDAAIGTSFPVGRQTFKLAVDVENLLNTRYRDYGSLLRYYADEPGRTFRARLSAAF